jgi:hypothetical protein
MTKKRSAPETRLCANFFESLLLLVRRGTKFAGRRMRPPCRTLRVFIIRSSQSPTRQFVYTSARPQASGAETLALMPVAMLDGERCQNSRCQYSAALIRIKAPVWLNFNQDSAKCDTSDNIDARSNLRGALRAGWPATIRLSILCDETPTHGSQSWDLRCRAAEKIRARSCILSGYHTKRTRMAFLPSNRLCLCSASFHGEVLGGTYPSV